MAVRPRLFLAALSRVFGLGAVIAAAVLRGAARSPRSSASAPAFSNTTILGIPIVLRAYGDAAAVPLSLILGFHSALLFTLTTVVAEIGAGVGTPLLTVVRKVVAGLLGNPILWGIAGGLVLNVLGLSLPAVVDQLAATLGMARAADGAVRARRQPEPRSTSPGHCARRCC